MKISDTTLSLIKSYSMINSSIYVSEGSRIRTISLSRNLLAESTVEETFPVEFAIYDLNEFLSVISLFTDPDFEFGTESVVVSEGGSRLTYRYANKSTIIYPEKEIKFPEKSVVVNLPKSVMDRVLKAGRLTRSTEIAFRKSDGSVTFEACDPNVMSSRFESEIEEVESDLDDYAFRFTFDEMKMIPADYEIAFAPLNGGKNWISRWSNPLVTYYSALEGGS